MQSPKLTIIVPTRDRADTLKYCLKTITAQKSPNIEIIVSDNFSGPEVKQVVDEVTDSRVRYIRTSERIGMSEHWNFALGHTKGEWITFIGDDDGLLPNATEKLFHLIEKHPDIKAITCANCFYRWPREKNSNEGVKLTLISGKGYEVRNCKDDLISLMNGKVIFLPTIYTGGFVRKDLIDEISSKSPNGEFFQSIIPDLYSQVAMSSVADKYIYSYEAWGIAGSSKHSNGGSMKNKTSDELAKMPFYQESKLKFNPKLGNGAIEAIQILFYESFLQSAHLRNSDFGITIEQQLQLAIVQAGKRIKQSTIDYCKNIAQINNLDFNRILISAKNKKPLYRAKKLSRKFLRHIPGVKKLNRININNIEANTVYDASLMFANRLN